MHNMTLMIISGPRLPYKLRGAAMVTSPSNKGVVVIGGYNHNEYKYSNSLLELNSNYMKWVQLEQTLQYARSNHVAFPIPDDFTNCISEK